MEKDDTKLLTLTLPQKTTINTRVKIKMEQVEDSKVQINSKVEYVKTQKNIYSTLFSRYSMKKIQRLCPQKTSV